MNNIQRSLPPIFEAFLDIMKVWQDASISVYQEEYEDDDDIEQVRTRVRIGYNKDKVLYVDLRHGEPMDSSATYLHMHSRDRATGSSFDQYEEGIHEAIREIVGIQQVVPVDAWAGMTEEEREMWDQAYNDTYG